MLKVPFTVTHAMLGANACVRTSALLCAMQDAATADAEINMNLGREALLRDHGGLWIVMRTSLWVERPIGVGELTQTTWHAGARAAIWPRAYIFTDRDDRIAARAVTWWTILSDEEPRRIVIVPAPEPCEPPYPVPKLLRPRMPALTPTGTHTVTPSELDENVHLNNALAANLIEDALPLDPAVYTSELHIHYAGEAKCGDTLTLSTGFTDGLHAIRVTHCGTCTHEAFIRRTALS